MVFTLEDFGGMKITCYLGDLPYVTSLDHAKLQQPGDIFRSQRRCLPPVTSPSIGWKTRILPNTGKEALFFRWFSNPHFFFNFFEGFPKGFPRVSQGFPNGSHFIWLNRSSLTWKISGTRGHVGIPLKFTIIFSEENGVRSWSNSSTFVYYVYIYINI